MYYFHHGNVLFPFEKRYVSTKETIVNNNKRNEFFKKLSQ